MENNIVNIKDYATKKNDDLTDTIDSNELIDDITDMILAFTSMYVDCSDASDEKIQEMTELLVGQSIVLAGMLRKLCDSPDFDNFDVVSCNLLRGIYNSIDL